MIRDHLLVYDDYIPSSLPVYTGVQHMPTLGQADQLGLHAVLDNAVTAAQLTIAIEHSTDGINWAPKSSTPEINSVSVVTLDTTSVYAGEPHPAPQSLEFVRLRITIVNNRGVNLRLYATLRDRGKGAFVGCGCHDDDDAEHDAHEHQHGDDHGRQVRELTETRPHAALEELSRRVAAGSAGEPLQERMKSALASMPEHQRVAAVQFLAQVGSLDTHPRET